MNDVKIYKLIFGAEFNVDNKYKELEEFYGKFGLFDPASFITKTQLITSIKLDYQKQLNELNEATAGCEESHILYKLQFANRFSIIELYFSRLIKILLTYYKGDREEVLKSNLFSRRSKEVDSINLEDIFTKVLDCTLYYKLEEYIEVLTKIINVDESEIDFKSFKSFVEVRHNIVHRNGYSKSFNYYPLTKKDIENLDELFEKTVFKIEKGVAKFIIKHI